MKKVRRFFALYWQALLSAAAIFLVVVGLLGFRLGTLTPGLSAEELEFIGSSATLDQIISNPLYLPMKLPMLALQYFDNASMLTTRAVGAIFGLLTVIIFYFVMRRWHTRRTALLTSFLLMVSSWFLQVSRLALPYVLFAFGIVALIAAAVVLYNKASSKLQLLMALLAVSVTLYIPGLIWFVILLIVWQAPAVRRALKHTGVLQQILGIMLAVLLLAPLGYAFYRDPALISTWLAFPTEFMLLEWLRRILVLPVFITAQGPREPIYNLGRLPLLDVFTTVLVVLGTYSYYFKAKLLRTQMLGLMAILAAVLIAFNGPTFLPLILPITFIVAGAGLTLLLQQWFTVFPRNPLARAAGILTIAAVIAITGMYHARRYFIAWSGNPDTRTVFIYQIDD